MGRASYAILERDKWVVLHDGETMVILKPRRQPSNRPSRLTCHKASARNSVSAPGREGGNGTAL